MNIISVLIVFVVISIFQLLVEGQRSAGCARPRIENGRAKIRARGKMVYYRCRKKFQRVGAKFAVCLSNGQWSLPPPICIGRGCPDITPTNGLKISGEYNGSMLKFTCPAGMKREGPETIYCNGKKWNADQPTCVVGISLQCDFEEEELCGWSQSDKDDFEWSWTSGHTPTVNTGPLHDHTFGSSGKGHFLFIESSSPRKPMDTAVLASPLYQAKYSDICFEFWYHMQGPEEENAVGSLEVFVKPESKTLDEIDPEFLMEGNQGENWKRGSIYIENQTDVFQIIIVGTRKEAFVSDIAIDDVRMYNCSEDATTEGEIEDLTTSDEVTVDMNTTSAEQEVTPVPKSTKITTSKVVTRPEPPITRRPTTMKPKTTKMKTTDQITTRKIPQTTTSTTTTPTTPTTRTTQMSTKKTVTTTATTKQMVTTPTRTASIKTTAKSKTSTTLRQKTKQTSPITRTTPTTVKTAKFPTTTTTSRLTTTTATSRVSTTMTKKTTPTKTPRANITYSTKMTTTKQTVTPKSFQSTRLHNSSSPISNLFVSSTEPSVVPETGNGTDRPGNATYRISDSPNDGNMTVNNTKIGIGIGRTKPSVGHGDNNSMPLIIGVSCGVTVGVIVIAALAYWWARRQRNKLSDETIEEMAPITNAEGGYYHPG